MIRVRDYLAQAPTIRVPEDIQDFVDSTSVNLSEFKLITKPTPAQTSEQASAYKRIDEAGLSRAKLTESVLTNLYPTYADLANITEGRAPSDETMRTRYIDAPGATYLLLDSRNSPCEWASDVAVRKLANADVATAIQYIGSAVPASYGLHRDLEVLHQRTIEAAGMTEWNPRSRILTGLLPIDLALVEGAGIAHYSTQTGLTRKDSA